MKVLLVCLALAAVSLAMPVAEEKPDIGAASPPVVATKSDEANDQPAPVEEKKSEEASASKEPEKTPEAIKPPAESQSEVKAEVTDKAPEVKSGDVVPEPKSAVSSESTQDSLEQKPEPSKATESKSEEIAAEPEAKSGEEPKPTEVAATVNEVPKDASTKPASMPEEAVDIVSAVKADAAVADEPIIPDVFVSKPEKKIDLPVIPAANAESIPSNSDSPASADEPAKTEESKAEQPEAEAKYPQPALDAAPKSEDTPATPSDDSLRVVRDTIEDKIKASADEEKIVPVEKNSGAAAEETKSEVQATDAVKVEESSKDAENKVEVVQKDSKPTETPKASEPAEKPSAAEPAPAALPKPETKEEKSENQPTEDKEIPLGTQPDSFSSSEESGESVNLNDKNPTEKESTPKTPLES